jgi:hypothetical protein
MITTTVNANSQEPCVQGQDEPLRGFRCPLPPKVQSTKDGPYGGTRLTSYACPQAGNAHISRYWYWWWTCVYFFSLNKHRASDLLLRSFSWIEHSFKKRSILPRPRAPSPVCFDNGETRGNEKERKKPELKLKGNLLGAVINGIMRFGIRLRMSMRFFDQHL